ncbi:mechanosensitive ion channel protein MscS [Prosthecochloris sp. GSB1]|uniref:mechanosensitive ion channel family protein n=1 Tax=Prosthecochloris sp. GSB1 TaxID=281093 RepID=UPI000B8D03D1|nr:mechanosensitive ion channel domain-containing protein [Prosthecochloris sp. GSB1]ASQ91246.1 mechanosensitive ion channel protein MscS [Prosthecochloris sp. GSB1]
MIESIKAIIREDPSRVFLVLVALLFGLLLYGIANALLKRGIVGIRLPKGVSTVELGRLYAPARVLFVLFLFVLFRQFMTLPGVILSAASHLLSIGFIVASAWLAIRVIAAAGAVIVNRRELERSDNLEARKLATHLDLSRKVLNVIIVVMAVAGVLMTFDTVRQVGVSMLASAGVAGIILGFAAQKSIATLVAGIQIAITQPIRIDDVVIVENEWGRVEEITLTYVVVRIWDERRLIVPVNHFIEKPFQNWTRTSARLVGSVYIHADYAVDIDAVRRELERIVAATPLWDKRVVNLQVTGASEKSIELRALVSAANSSDTWDLRCLVRESLLRFLQRNYPESLPKVRFEGPPGPA